MILYTILQHDLAALRPKLLNHQQYADDENNQSINQIEIASLLFFFLFQDTLAYHGTSEF